MSDFLIAQIRTWVPALAGAIIAFLLSVGVLDEDTSNEALVALTTFGTALFTGLYYLLVRVLAERWPWAGNLLGVNVAPKYPEG